MLKNSGKAPEGTMRGLVEHDTQNRFGNRLQVIEQSGVRFHPVHDQFAGDSSRPVNIHINVNRDTQPSNDKSGFNIFRSKIVWFLLTLALTAGVSYARTRYMCQGFKDGGKFYYGMDVSRCVGILIQEPFANLEQQLSAINKRY